MRRPAAWSAARRASRAVSATDSRIGASLRAGLAGVGGDGRVAEGYAQVSVVDVGVGVAAGAAGGAAGAGCGRQLDQAAQGVADGGVAELGEGGQGGVPADGVPGPGLGLVPAEQSLPS